MPLDGLGAASEIPVWANRGDTSPGANSNSSGRCGHSALDVASLASTAVCRTSPIILARTFTMSRTAAECFYAAWRREYRWWRNASQRWAGSPRRWIPRRCRATVRSETTKPSFASSPCNLGAPHPAKAGARPLPLEDCHLLAQSKDFQGHVAASAEEDACCGKERGDK
jgi:hypothetical protein